MTENTAAPTSEAVPDLTPEELDRVKHAMGCRIWVYASGDPAGDVYWFCTKAVPSLLSMARRTAQAEKRAKEAEAKLKRLLTVAKQEGVCLCTFAYWEETLTRNTAPACPVHGEEAG